MGDRGVRWRLNSGMTARKSAPVSAGGVNSRRLEAARASRLREAQQLAQQFEEAKEEEEPPQTKQRNLCGNPFCRQILANRYAKFCEESIMCQRYRALKLQCQANKRAEDEEDQQPLSLLRRKKKKKKVKDKIEMKQKEVDEDATSADEPFAIPRRKLSTKKRRLMENNTTAGGEETNSTGLRRKKLLKKKKLVERLEKLDEQQQETKKDKIKQKRAREALKAGWGSSSTSTSNNPSDQTFPVSSVDEGVLPPSDKGNKTRDLRIQRGSREASSDAEGKSGTENGRSKKRRLNRRISADDVLMRSASLSPIPAVATTPGAAALSSDTPWKIPRSRGARPATAAQAIKRMGVELVPLGVSNQSVNFAGGGRYVQSGNRSAAQLTNTQDTRPRPNKTKFVSPKPTALPSGTSALATRPSSSNAPFRPKPSTTSLMPAQSSPPPLPPLPPQVLSQVPPLPPPVSQSMEPARTVTPSSSPVRQVAAESHPMPSSSTTSPTTTTVSSRTTSTVTGANANRRISASEYLKKMNHKRQSEAREDLEQPQAPSLGLSSSLADERSSGFPPAPFSSSMHPNRPPNDYHSDSAPLPPPTSSVEYRIRDSRHQYPENREQYLHQQVSYNDDGGRMNHPDGFESRGRSMSTNAYLARQRDDHNIPPPRDFYPPRPPPSFSANARIGGGGYEYDADVHFSPQSSPPDQSYWREPPHSEPPHQRPSIYNELGRMEGDRNSPNFDNQDEDMPIFSYHEPFTSRLLSIFIDKFPHALEAVRNVTKKPRKMNWYVQYIERIERLCQPHDVRVKFEGLSAMVMVYGREWLTLKGQSTITLHREVIKHLLDEALTWRQLREGAEEAFKHYQSIYHDEAKMNITFLRAWNDIKLQGKLSLERQANYFCGARLHHWNFVVGKVEIGSGSHEDKREAFRLATISALDFLLSLGQLRRRPYEGFSEVRRSRPSESEKPSERKQRPNQSHDDRARGSPASEHTDTASAGPPSSPVTIERSEKAAVAIIPSTDSNTSSRETAASAEQSDPGEEMSISDASDVDISSVPDLSTTSTSTPATSPPVQPNAALTSVVASTPQPVMSAPASKRTTPIVEGYDTASVPSTKAVHPITKPPAAASVAAPATEFGNKTTSATNEGTSALETAKKAVVVDTSRRCMMCEMIRMRKPDGERCLRCQQNDANRQASTLPGT